MNKTAKVDILYKKAMGQQVNISPEEKQELSKYKVSRTGKPYTTKENIKQYITAVDQGYSKAFYDWCIENRKGDSRTKAGKAEAIKSYSRSQNFGIMAIGWLFWGIAIYWTAGGRLSANVCAIAGAAASVMLYRMKREMVAFTCILLPLILTYFFGVR
ncbi:MAG: hypothetical protein HFG92_05585 [Dorea sp.]|jgi:hypothetical protein|nr:hypothetical protein [Dorea sp.]